MKQNLTFKEISEKQLHELRELRSILQNISEEELEQELIEELSLILK
jgi:hypothetical protein